MSIKIISGEFKKRSIVVKKNLNIKPTLARARKMVFDILINKIGTDFSFLDCFAGSGAMGIEALSLGAKRVIFFEYNRAVFENLRRNLLNLQCQNWDAIRVNSLKPPVGQPMDVIFIDPPYEKSFIITSLIKKLLKNNWIDNSTNIICEIPKDAIIDQPMNIWKERKVSNSIFIFFNLLFNH